MASDHPARRGARQQRVRHASSRRVTMWALGVAVGGVLPVFLCGGLVVQIRAELALGHAAFGSAVTAFFVATGLGSVLLGRLVESIGPQRGMRLAMVMSVASLAGIGASSSWLMLTGFLTLGGLANAVSHPATNLSLSRAIRDARLGLAFGLKQSAIPASTLLGGLAVPTVGLAVGWRWAFALAALVGTLGAVLIPPSTDPRPSVGDLRLGVREQTRSPALIILAAGGGLAAAAATPLGTFLVDAGVEAGLTEVVAGLVFAAASASGLATRVALGWLVDQHGIADHFGIIVGMLGVGAVGSLTLAAYSAPLVPIGAVLGFCFGWGWMGLFHFGIVWSHRERAAAATGVAQAGLSLGAALGPFSFGFIVEHASYAAAWSTAAATAAIAAAIILTGRRRLGRERAAGTEVGRPLGRH